MNTVGGFRVPVQDRIWTTKRTSVLHRTEMSTVDGFRVPLQDRTWRTRRTSVLHKTDMNTVDGFRVPVQDRSWIFGPGEPGELVYYIRRR